MLPWYSVCVSWENIIESSYLLNQRFYWSLNPLWQCYLFWLIDSGQVDIRVAPGSHATEAAGKTVLLFSSFFLWVSMCYFIMYWTYIFYLNCLLKHSAVFQVSIYFLLLRWLPIPFFSWSNECYWQTCYSTFLVFKLFWVKELRCCFILFDDYLFYSNTTILLRAPLFQRQFAGFPMNEQA